MSTNVQQNFLPLLKQYTVSFQLLDASKNRYEVPLDTPKVTKKAASTDYQIEFQQQPFGLKITRKSSGAVL